MKYLCIGDIHGKVEYVEEVLSDKFDDYHKIFVGDYVDSFDRSVLDQIAVVTTLLEASEREDVTCLIGNHELSYIKPGMHCSGFNTETDSYMTHLHNGIYEQFKTHFWVTENILVTHAGAHGELFGGVDDLVDALSTDDPRLYGIGRCRGGSASYGGIFWCDFWAEFINIHGLIQIVGHTAHRPKNSEGAGGIVEMDNCFNIDCLDRVPEALIVDTEAESEDVFKIINFLTYTGEE